MKADLSGPADTSMMGIVHRALRRDLARARAALTADWPPADDQRVAIAAHLGCTRWSGAAARPPPRCWT